MAEPVTSKITHFTVFGERCSGTNHAAAWIHQNTGLVERRHFGWKHGAIDVRALKKSPQTLCVLVTRNLPDWLRSLHLRPHHLCPEMRGLPFDLFIKRRAESIWDHQMGVSPRSAKFGTLIESETWKGKPYANVIRMRRHKHKVWLDQGDQLPNALHLRHEDLLARPVEMLHKILTACRLPLRDDPAPVSAYKGQTEKKQYPPFPSAPIGAEAMRHIMEQVDWEMEARLGYDTRADLEAASFVEPGIDFDLLRTALAGHADALSMLDALERKLLAQEHQLGHALLLARTQKRYLKTLFEALERTQPRFLPWKAKRRRGKPEG